MLKKGLAIGIFVLFVGISIVPSTATNMGGNKLAIINNNSNTLYVGGDGPGNYTSIQAAIDDASDGDTVFVYDDSSPYYENINIINSINLVGEDKNTTIIDGSEGSQSVRTNADGITITGFTIQKGGVYIHSNDNQIFGNIITRSSKGIEISDYGSNNIVKGNRIVLNSYGLYIDDDEEECDNNLFTENFIAHNKNAGIYDNDRKYGGVIATWNVIADNGIRECSYFYAGIWKHDSDSVYHHNDLFYNGRNVVIDCGRFDSEWDDGSEGNYWSDWKNNPGYPDTYIIPDGVFGDEVDRYPSAVRWTNDIVVDGSSSHGRWLVYVIINNPVDFYCRARGGTSPYSYHWDFGDGNTSDKKEPTHTFKTPGTYEVTITVTDNDSNTDTDRAATVKVGIGPPGPTTIDGPTSIKVDQLVYYSFMATDPDGDDIYYRIDWGDGTYCWDYGPYDSGEEAYIEHWWSEPGNYTIHAWAKDGTGYGPEGTFKVSVTKDKAIVNQISQQSITPGDEFIQNTGMINGFAQ